MQKKIKIIYNNKGLANYYGDYIEINKNLKYNKPLRDYIIIHELEHSKKFDLSHDFNDGIGLIFNPKMFLKILLFYIRNPSTWIDLSPVQIKNRKIVYDLNLSILYLIIAGLMIFAFKSF